MGKKSTWEKNRPYTVFLFKSLREEFNLADKICMIFPQGCCERDHLQTMSEVVIICLEGQWGRSRSIRGVEWKTYSVILKMALIIMLTGESEDSTPSGVWLSVAVLCRQDISPHDLAWRVQRGDSTPLCSPVMLTVDSTPWLSLAVYCREEILPHDWTRLC